MIEAKTAAQFQALWTAAVAAGMAAGEAAMPNPMVIGPGDIMVNGENVVKQYYVVAEGVCGFAWVVIKPATSAGA